MTCFGSHPRLTRYLLVLLLLSSIVGILSVTSCAFMPFCADGRHFEKNRISQIVEYETTRRQIQDLFGDPVETDARDMSQAGFWRYRYVYLGTLTVQRAELGIYFDGDIVSRLQYKENETRF